MNPSITKEQQDKIIASINPDKIVKDNQENLLNATYESMANERAAREPLPSIVEEAVLFSNEPITVTLTNNKDIVNIRPMVAYDINIFKLINSPFYSVIMGDKVEVNEIGLFASEEESYEIIYQFTHSPKEIYKLFKKGKDSFKDAVMDEVAFKYSPVDAYLLVSKIMEHIFKVNLARVEFVAPKTEDNKDNTDDKKKLLPTPEALEKIQITTII